ncbi:hypothetical protein SAMN05421807_11710 [Virgibacillus chiguensis]|uniref:Uncharacterized protein n=1 Tax=Virgibacillus chiguensis TaxID=411959 RepID=A0A1M5WKU6_9BACI|nr:hypothetical protein SAMN05421807_11710 [Virgibacillus chiguensis]
MIFIKEQVLKLNKERTRGKVVIFSLGKAPNDAL